MTAFPTTSGVQTIIDRLIELLTPKLPGVQVEPAPPMDMPRQCVFIGNVREIKHTYPVIRPGRKPRDETFIVYVHFRAGIDQSQGANEARSLALEWQAALENVIADDPNLGMVATDPTLSTRFAEGIVGLTAPPDNYRAEAIGQVHVRHRLK